MATAKVERLVVYPGAQAGGRGLDRRMFDLLVDSLAQLGLAHLCVRYSQQAAQGAAVVGFHLLLERSDHGLGGDQRVRAR